MVGLYLHVFIPFFILFLFWSLKHVSVFFFLCDAVYYLKGAENQWLLTSEHSH